MDPTRPSHRTWSVPLLCFLALVADGYDLFSYGAVLPDLTSPGGLGFSTATASGLAAVGLVGVLLGAIVTGMLTDRFGRRRMLIASVTVFSLAMIGCALAPDPAVFGVCRFVSGFGVGGLIPAAVALASESADPRYRSRILGVAMTGPSIGGALASLAALGLLAEHGFRPVLALGALPLILVVPAAVVLLPESRVQHARVALADRRSVPKLFENGVWRVTIGLWVITLLVMLNVFGVSTWLPQIMKNAGYAVGSAITFLLVFTCAAVVGTLVSSNVAERFGAKPLVVSGCLVGGVGLVLLATVHTQGALLIAIAIAGLGSGTAQSLLNDHVAGYYPAEARATGLGWALGIGRIGAIGGPIYGGILVASNGGVTLAAVAFAVPALLAGVLMAFLPRRSSAFQRSDDAVLGADGTNLHGPAMVESP